MTTNPNHDPDIKAKVDYVEIDGKTEAILNASAVVELARSEDTPSTRRFLAAYHEAESRLAATCPYLSEGQIRSDAVIAALRSLGAKIVKIAR